MDGAMARKRMISPEFWSDEEVGSWSYAARLFYIGLWSFADDEGRFKANCLLLKAQIFPYDRQSSIKKLKLELGNKIQWYSDEKNGSQYGYIRNFLKYQRIDRPTPSILPPPPEVNFDEPSMNPRRPVLPNISKVKLREDNISQKTDNLSIFALARKVYPGTKRGSQTEFDDFIRKHKDWEKVLPLLESAVQQQISFRLELAKNHNNFVPPWKNFKTWLGQRCWEETIAVKTKPKKSACACGCGNIGKTSVSNQWFWNIDCRRKVLGW